MSGSESEAPSISRMAIRALQAEVDRLQAQNQHKSDFYVKKAGKISFFLRQAMAESVAKQGSSFEQAYDGVLSAWRLMRKRPQRIQAEQPGMGVIDGGGNCRVGNEAGEAPAAERQIATVPE